VYTDAAGAITPRSDAGSLEIQIEMFGSIPAGVGNRRDDASGKDWTLEMPRSGSAAARAHPTPGFESSRKPAPEQKVVQPAPGSPTRAWAGRGGAGGGGGRWPGAGGAAAAVRAGGGEAVQRQAGARRRFQAGQGAAARRKRRGAGPRLQEHVRDSHEEGTKSSRVGGYRSAVGDLGLSADAD